MAWDHTLTNLNHLLAGLYPLTRDVIRLVDSSGLPKAHIAFSERSIDTWHSVIDEAQKRGKIATLIGAARADYPDDPALILAERGSLSSVRGPTLGLDIPWSGEPLDSNEEKIIGSLSTLVPVNFLEIGIQQARAVVRVSLVHGALGSGFLISQDRLVTNHHVIATPAIAAGAIIQCNYQEDLKGGMATFTEFRLDPDQFFVTSKEDDWTIVKVAGDANRNWGMIDVAPNEIYVGDRVNIIQHPSGGPKQLSYFHNQVTFVDERRVQYLTDTLPGSSGSPVFDSRWRLVAIHHSGGWIPEPSTKRKVFRNEGIRLQSLYAHLHT